MNAPGVPARAAARCVATLSVAVFGGCGGGTDTSSAAMPAALAITAFTATPANAVVGERVSLA